MSDTRHRFTLEVTVDTDALADEVERNGGNAYPCSTDPSEWYDVDLFAALDKGIAEAVVDSGIVDYEAVAS